MSEKLPQGWEVAELGALGRWRGGGTPSKSVPAYWSNGTVHWVSPKDMKRLMIDSAEDQITLAAVKESAANLIPKDSVLMVTRSGILEHTFPVAINTVEVAVNQDLKAWTPHPGINPLYAAYFLKAEGRTILDDCAKDGTTVASIDFDRLKAYPVRLAPEPEQARIVSKIDELFSSIDEGERALERVRKLVERYRQSVLKAAVTGELTRDWREQHAGELESGEALLTRILNDRIKAWETAELSKMMAKKQCPSNDLWKKRYKVPETPETADLPELPQGWVWSSLGQLFSISPGSTPLRKQSSYWNGGIPWVSSGEVAFCRIKETRETISEKGFKNSSVRLCPIGTVLLAMIGEGKTRGQAAILDIPACHNQNSASIRVSDTPIPPEYIYHFLRFRYEITRATGQGGNQPALSGEIVKSIQIPLPPLVEIAAICEAIEMQFNVLANCESSLNGLENLIEAQKKVILREAFSGRLVSQDSTDEPASLLIERIAAERAPCEQSSTKGKSNRRWPSGMTAREIATRKPASRKGEAKA